MGGASWPIGAAATNRQADLDWPSADLAMAGP